MSNQEFNVARRTEQLEYLTTMRCTTEWQHWKRAEEAAEAIFRAYRVENPSPEVIAFMARGHEVLADCLATIPGNTSYRDAKTFAENWRRRRERNLNAIKPPSIHQWREMERQWAKEAMQGGDPEWMKSTAEQLADSQAERARADIEILEAQLKEQYTSGTELAIEAAYRRL